MSRRRRMGRRSGKLMNECDFDERPTNGYVEIPLDDFIERGLFDKREQVRGKALSEIIKAFSNNRQHKIAENKFATIMLRCLNSIKKGSAKEICLATKAIGLLAMVRGPSDNAHELFEESLSMYSETLNSKPESGKVLECLGIVTLVGAEDFMDTERSMKVIWESIHSNLSKKPSAPILSASIFAWSFLLATIDGRRIDHKYWQGAISDLLNLLKQGGSVRDACVEALGIIFEKGCLEKFSTEAYKVFIHSLAQKEDTTSCLEEWKDKIMEQVKTACGPNWEVSDVFEEQQVLDICGNTLKYSTLSELKKIKFIKQFLGDAFEIHMMENKLLHRVFDFEKYKAPLSPEIYVPETEEVTVRLFVPDIRRDGCKQRFEKSSNSPVSKARTQLMKKHRLQAQERKTGDIETW